MHSSHSLMTTAEALRRVFIRPNLPALAPAPCSSSTPSSWLQQRRFTLSSTQASNKYASKGSSTSRFGPAPSVSAPVDERISSPYVRIVQPDNSLSQEPESIADVLRAMDRQKYFLKQVSPANSDDLPVCKILDKQLVYQEERSRAAPQKKPPRTGTKTVQLRWGVAAHDLEHKLKRMGEFLAAGRKVEVEITLRKRTAAGAVSMEECKALVRKVRDKVGEMQGAREAKPMTGEIGQMAAFYFEGNAHD